MSGYLRWLAGRALGQGSGIRPLHPSISLARTGLGETPLSADHVEAAPVNLTQGQSGPPSGASPRHQTISSADAGDDIPVATSLAFESNLESGKPQERGVPAAIRRIPIHAAAKDEPRPVPETRDAPDRRRTDDQRDIMAEMPPPTRSATEPENRPLDIAGRPRSTSERPLAPRVAARAIRNRHADVRTSDFEATPPADVHIHIGRVELTAIAPAAPARRESAATAKKPMSLDEYLRQRGRRPS